jgi:hypothetical protein
MNKILLRALEHNEENGPPLQFGITYEHYSTSSKGFVDPWISQKIYTICLISTQAKWSGWARIGTWVKWSFVISIYCRCQTGLQLRKSMAQWDWGMLWDLLIISYKKRVDVRMDTLNFAPAHYNMWITISVQDDCQLQIVCVAIFLKNFRVCMICLIYYQSEYFWVH